MSADDRMDRGNEFTSRYGNKFQTAEQLMQLNKYEEAVQLFMNLLSKPSNPFIKTILWINIAVVRDKMGLTDEAVRAYDEAAVLELSYHGFAALEHKAAYYAKLGRIREGLEILETIGRRTGLTGEDRVRVETNISILRRQA